VEQETGLSKDQLRVWERRYGFPSPPRNDHGERQYSDQELAKLKVVRRLMDKGMRPGRLLGLPIAELLAMSAVGGAAERSAPLDLALYLLQTHQTVELHKELGQTLMRDGMFRFITETAAPLSALVGEAWMRGELRIFEEHMYTEILQGILRSAIAQGAAPGGAPKVLLTTLPSEQHGLGMLMAEAVCVLEGAECVRLGVQTPIGDVLAAAAAKQADIVALSFSGNFPANQMSENLDFLRANLPGGIALWCGGAGAIRAKRIPDGVKRIAGLHQIGPAISEWRAAAAGGPQGFHGG